MNIIQHPDLLSLSMNLKKFIVSSSETISFVLHHRSEEILSQRYEPGANGRIEIDVCDVIHSRLEYDFQETSLVYIQSRLAENFTARIDNTEIVFRVIRGGVDRLADSPTSFLTQNFLTWQPSTKAVTYHSPEFLTYYAVVPCVAKLKAYFGDGEDIEKTEIIIAEFIAGNAYTIPLQYAVVSGLLGNRLPSYYDVWVENLVEERLTYIQRYHVGDLQSIDEDWILFENSLGGLDTFRAYGELSLNVEHTHNVAEIDERSLEYRVDTERKYSKNTGHLDAEQSRWLLDFFPSGRKYLYTGNYMRPIVVIESNVSAKVRKAPANYTFVFKFADAGPLLNLPRTDVPAEMLNMAVPDIGSFTIPPRLSDFPRLLLSEGVLLPVQNPYSENWGTTTIGALVEAFSVLLAAGGNNGGIGHTHANIDLLNLLSLAKEYLLVAGKKIKAGYADTAGEVEGDKYLRKDRPDRTDYLLQIGEFIDSLIAGKGIGLFPNGRAQFGRVEIRDSLTVLRLIINEIQAMAGDYSFSDCGYIERVDKIDDTTYKLWMEKRTDTDWTNLDEHDVLLSIVNSLLTGGTDYYSSWFRCVAKNRNENSLTVVLYPDSEVPGGKNYPPVAGYNVTRKGNAIMPEAGETNERAQSWLISSREGRIIFLQNVFKPILEDYNYAISIGRFPSVKMIRKLPISPTDVGIMAKTIVAENFYQADWNGDIIPKKVDRGEWSLAVAQGESPYRNVSHEVTLENQSVVTQLEQHTVYHYGCKWGCVIDKTTDEPKWNAPGWILLEGDKNYHLDFTSTNGWQFFHRSVDTVVSAVVSYGNRDITEVLMASDGVQVEWLRDTGNVPADNAWQPTYVDGKKHAIHLTRADMGSEWGLSVRKVRFVCRVFVPIGGGKFEKTENYIGFKI